MSVNAGAKMQWLRALKRGRDKALEEFHNRLASLTFFDPACGCGNFLVIAYRELRDLEIAVIKERFEETFNRPGMRARPQRGLMQERWDCSAL
jgi:type II restriction/modification system DNA methylase subunit YeeA